MTVADITAQRLHNQHLIKKLANPIDVVGLLGAVQAQDFVGARWALGLRCDATDQEVIGAFDEGRILRTHALRPTWHFIDAADIRWIQELTGPRVHSFNKYYYKKLGVDEPTARKASRILTKALSNQNYLTKPEIAQAFKAEGIKEPSGLRLGYLLMHAELDALICSGPLRGKQHTYALLDERAPGARSLSREQALAELVHRFFASHGPAQIHDFAWWSSLSISEVREGIDLAKLKSAEIEGRTYYFTSRANVDIPSPVVHLLPNYDEYFIAYKDRRAFSQPRTFKLTHQPDYKDLSYHLIALDGQLAGGWKRIKGSTVKMELFTKLNSTQKQALDKAIESLEYFVNS